MHTRGNFTSNWLFYFVAVVVLILVFTFGGKSIVKVKDTGCDAGRLLFVQKLKADAEEISFEQGSVVDREYLVGCGVDRIYFVDYAIVTENDLNKHLLDPLPLVREEVVSKTGKNVFFYSGNRMVDAVEIAALSMELPYYRCLQVRSGNIKVRFTGKGAAVDVDANGDQFGCDPVIQTIAPTEEEKEELLDEIGRSDKAGDAVGDEIKRELEAGGVPQQMVIAAGITAQRVIEEEPGGSSTTVTVLFELIQAKRFKYVEQFDADCVDNNVAALLDETPASFSGQPVQIRSDPLIVWTFPVAPVEPPHVQYTLNTLLNEECKDSLKGFPVEFKPKAPVDGGQPSPGPAGLPPPDLDSSELEEFEAINALIESDPLGARDKAKDSVAKGFRKAIEAILNGLLNNGFPPGEGIVNIFENALESSS